MVANKIWVKLPVACLGMLALWGCKNTDVEVTPAYDAIAPTETVSLAGTEPFWSIDIEGDTLIYSSPDKPDGLTGTVERFEGNGGLSYAGKLDDTDINITVTPGECSDGMSDTIYPLTATVSWRDALLKGCGNSDSQPVKQPAGS